MSTSKIRMIIVVGQILVSILWLAKEHFETYSIITVCIVVPIVWLLMWWACK